MTLDSEQFQQSPAKARNAPATFPKGPERICKTGYLTRINIARKSV